MDCSRIKELIPLYVEGDLATDRQSLVSSHLKTCGECAHLLGEYKESQSWLRTIEPPQFDEAFFSGLRSTVLAQVAEKKTPPAWSRLFTGRWNFAGQWNMRPAFSVAAALIILSLLAFYLSSEKGINNRDEASRIAKGEEEKKESSPARSGGDEDKKVEDDKSEAMLGMHKSERLNPERKPARRQIFVTPRTIAKRVAPQFSNSVEKENQGANLNSVKEAATELGMVRMDIQTSDPSVRIIWFAPKEVEPQSLRP